MKIEINIPKEFEKEYSENKFKDTFDRVTADVYWNMTTHEPSVAGNYEYETLKMLSEVFANSKVVKEENSPNNILEKDLLFEQEANNKEDIELQRKKVEEEIKRCSEEAKKYEEKHREDYEEYKKAGYRELEKEEISKKSCWQCSHFRGGYIGAGCWCSQEICDYKENANVLVPQ